MNILYISELSNLGGGETSLLNLIMEFKNNFSDVKPILLCFNDGKLTEESIEGNVKTIVYDFIGDVKKFKFIRCIKKIKNIIASNKIEIIQTNQWKSAFILKVINKLCLLKCRVIWVCHGQWYKFNFVKKSLINLFIDKIVCVSTVVKDNLIRNGINSSKIVKIPLGIDINKFTNCDSKKIRREFKLSEDEKVFAVIGRFQEIKGQRLVIEAAKELKKLGRKFKILFVGDSIFENANDDIYKNECLNLIEEYGLKKYCLFLGVRRDIGDILTNIDALIVPSINESFGMVIIEALAAGCIIISTPNDGAKEIIRDGISGFILNVRTTRGLVDKMQQILDDKIDLREISENQKKDSKNYSITRICGMYKSIYTAN